MGYLDYAGLHYFWGKLKEKFAPKSHTHDDRYYTESEMDGKLNSKVNNNEAGANGLLSKLSVWTTTPTDDTYFMRQDTGGTNTFGRVKFSTIWNYIKGKADGVYQPKGSYAASGHTHDMSTLTGNVINTEPNTSCHKIILGKSGLNKCEFFEYGGIWNFYKMDTDTPSLVASIQPDGIHATLKGTADIANSVDWSKVQNKPSSYTPASHNHDDRYYTEAEIDAKLNEKAVNKTLLKVDLNTVKTPGFYNAGGENGCTNVPVSDAFGLIVTHNASGEYYTQIFFLVDKNISYRRYCNAGAWSGWTQDKLTDTNTWRGIQNNLTSDSTSDSLSAAQGKVLKNLVDSKAPNGHTHPYLPLSGGTMTGALNFANDTWNVVGDDVQIGDHNTSGSFFVQGLNGATNIKLKRHGDTSAGSGDSATILYDGGNLIVDKTIQANLSGNASTATKATSADKASKLTTARTVSGGSDIVLDFKYDGSANSTANIGFYSCIHHVANTNNYPFHRFAKLSANKNAWVDNSMTFLISQDYDGGGYGICRLVYRSNADSSNANVEAQWLVRRGLSTDTVQVAIKTDKTNGAYCDAFYKSGGTYKGAVIRAIASGGRASFGRTWVLIDSGEVNGTTTTDKKTSYECWKTIDEAGTSLHNQAYSGFSPAKDEGFVGSAGTASTADRATTSSKLGRGGDNNNPMVFNWVGQGGQPSWLWGGNDGTNMYVYNPSNFSVNTAKTAAIATTGVRDYNNANRTIRIGYGGAGLTKDNLAHIAGYTEDGNKIKDVSKGVLQGWLGLGDSAYKKTKTRSSKGSTDWNNNATDDAIVPTMSFMAYWDGAYNTDGTSNLSYCDRGRFGTIVTKNSGDYLSLSGGTMSGNVSFADIGNVGVSNKLQWNGSTDGADIYYQTTAGDQGNLVLNLRDDSNCYLRIAKNGEFKSYFSPDDGNFHGNVNGTADRANAVDWSRVQNKPSSYTPASHNQSWNTITGKPALMESGDYSTETIELLLKKVQGVSPRMGSCNLSKDTHVANTWWNFIYTPHRTGSGEDNPDYGTLLLFPMVDVGSSYIIRAGKDGAVREVRKIYTSSDKPTKGDIGLGNVDNTADANKSVKYATSAGSASTATKATTADSADIANSVDWSKVQNKPSSYTPASHNHDDRYYTETEMNAKLNGKSNTGHTHDDRYYTESEVNSMMNGKLSLSGGTMNNGATINFADSGAWIAGNGTYPRDCGGLSWSGQSDGVHLYAEETGGDNLELVVRFTDDNSNGMSFRNAVGTTTARITANGDFTGTASTSNGVKDYNDIGRTIRIGYSGEGLNTSTLTHIAGYTDNGTKIKDVSKDVLKSWIGLGSYLPLGGGTMSGQIKRSVGCNWINDRDSAIVYGTGSGASSGYHPVVGQKTPSGAWTIGTFIDENLIFNYTKDTDYNAGTNNGTQIYLPAQAGTIITSATIGSQSVNYANSAGSATNATNATTATKLSSSAGSNVQPVYFSGGKPVAIGYTIAKSVPADAKFTDTTYGVATTSSNGLMSADDKTKMDGFSRIISIQKQIKLTTDWQDVGIAGTNLESGTYVVQVSGFNSDYTGLYNEMYSGIMTWYASETNSDNSSEIFLHNAGHADNANAIYLRTSRRGYGNGGLHLQIACREAASGTDTLTFKFRRLI